MGTRSGKAELPGEAGDAKEKKARMNFGIDDKGGKRMRGIRGKVVAAALVATAALAATPVPAYAWGFSFGAKAEEKAEESYVFRSGETDIVMGGDSAPVVRALGTPLDTFEADSCAYQGKDIIYSYSGFELGTHPDGGVDVISSVYVLDPAVSTPEGLQLGDPKSEITKLYGKGYTLENGVYRYVKGSSELAIYTTGGIVDAIEYTAIAE